MGDESYTGKVEMTIYITFLISISSQLQSVPETRISYKKTKLGSRND